MPKPMSRSRGSRVSRVVGLSGGGGVVGKTAAFLADYIALHEREIVVTAAWTAAAWLADQWDRFPHLAITSPEPRCGKTTFLDTLEYIVPRPRPTTNISPAALYRVIEKEMPTLLMDEAQSVSRQGSEAAMVTREILNAGIVRDKAKVIRCGGQNRDQIEEFNLLSAGRALNIRGIFALPEVGCNGRSPAAAGKIVGACLTAGKSGPGISRIVEITYGEGL